MNYCWFYIDIKDSLYISIYGPTTEKVFNVPWFWQLETETDITRKSRFYPDLADSIHKSFFQYGDELQKAPTFLGDNTMIEVWDF